MDSVVVNPSDIEGLGVFAARPFQSNDVILAIDDSRVVGRDTPLTADEQERHCDYLEAGKVVLMQPPERYINHSCDPNTYVKTVNGKRFVIARREIQTRDEVTYDYSVNGGGDTIWLCRCGASRCRRNIHSDFFHLPIEFQREYLPELDDWFVKERQDDITHLRQQLSTV
jgi:CDGSH-type Zn-finger protein